MKEDRTYYTPETMANNLAQHTFDKHISEFGDSKLGNPIEGIDTKQDIEEHIQRTIEDNETYYYKSPLASRDIFYNQGTNTIAVYSPNIEKGTCFRPTEYEGKFMDYISNDNEVAANQGVEFEQREINSLEDVEQGGFKAMYPDRFQDIDKTESEKKFDEETLPSDLSQNAETQESEYNDIDKDSLPHDLSVSVEAQESEQDMGEDTLPSDLSISAESDISDTDNDIGEDMGDNAPDAGDSSDSMDL